MQTYSILQFNVQICDSNIINVISVGFRFSALGSGDWGFVLIEKISTVTSQTVLLLKFKPKVLGFIFKLEEVLKS